MAINNAVLVLVGECMEINIDVFFSSMINQSGHVKF